MYFKHLHAVGCAAHAAYAGSVVVTGCGGDNAAADPLGLLTASTRHKLRGHRRRSQRPLQALTLGC